MATRFNPLDIDLAKHNYSAEELSKMPLMEQLVISNRIRNQQMLQTLGLNADNKSRRVTPKQQNAKDNKSKKDVDWTPDMAAEEYSDNAEMFVGKKSSTATRKSHNSFTPPTNACTSTYNWVNPAIPTELPATVAGTTFAKSAKRRIRKKAAQTASETDKPVSPSNIYINPSSYQNQSAQKKNTSASGKPAQAAIPPPAWLQPFTGFTAEQIEAARRRSTDAQNRKEAIVRFTWAKLLNGDDLAIIEPVDCDKCQKDYEGHRICPLHYDASGHLNKAKLDNRSQVTGYNAMKSLPEGLLVKESPIPGAGRGVFTGQFTTLPKDMIFGPYEGVMIYNERESHQSGFYWQIYTKRKISHWIDARQVRRSNWLRYINCAATMDQQNVCAYQVGQNIYYRTVVDIGPDTELLVWYGDDYARELGLQLSMAFMASINSITIDGVDLACWDCQLEFRCRQLLNQHKFTAQDSVNSDIVDVVGKTCCVANTGGTSRVLGSVAQPDALVHKSRVARSTRSAISDVVVASPGSTLSGAMSYNLHGTGTDGGVCTAGSCTTDSVVDRCRVTAVSGCADVSLSDVQPTVDSSRVVATDDGRRFQCSTCCKLFQNRAELVKHTRIHTGEKPFECTTCGARFTRNSHLITHCRIHTGEKPFECTTCGERFTDSSHFTRHSRIHTGEKLFACTTCGQRFTRNDILTTHSRVHTGEKPFACTTCGQRFTDSSNLTRHSRIHTGDKLFACTTCGQRFTRNDILTTHSRVHTGEKPFACTTCGQRFTRNDILTTHSRVHTGEKPFECTTCGERFTQSSNLTTHSRIHWKKCEHDV